MGSWLSAVLSVESLFFGPSNQRKYYLNAYHLSYKKSYPTGLLKTAAEIAALQRMEKKSPLEPSGSSAMSSSYNYDTDVEDVMQSDNSEFSSDDEVVCTPMDRAAEERMFERERQMAFRGRLTIGDQESFQEIRNDITVRCGCAPSTSVSLLCSKREIGGGRKVRAAPGKNYTGNCTRAAICNEFFPNSRKVVQEIQSKTFCCQYIKNGQELVIASQDERIRMFAKNSPSESHLKRYTMFREIQVQICQWSILDVVLNRQGTGLLYGTWKNAVFYARLDESPTPGGRSANWHLLEIGDTAHYTAVFSVRFSHDGREVLCGSSDYNLHVFDLETKTRLVTIHNAHDDDVNSVCYGSDDGNLIFSAGDDGLVKVWDRRAWSENDHHPVGLFAGHRDGITYVDSRRDDRYLLSNCKDQTIKLWDLRKFSNNEGADHTRKCVSSQKWDYRWQPAPPGLCQPVDGDTSVLTLRGHNVLHTLVRAKFSPERTGKRYIYTGCARGEVVVYDLLTGLVCNRLKGHVGVIRDVDWNPDDNEIVACAWDGVTSVWQWDERKSRATGPGEMGDEDSCDEMFKSVIRKKNATPKSYKKRQRRRQTTNFSDSDLDCEMPSDDDDC